MIGRYPVCSRLGSSTIAVGDHTGYLHNPEGFNPHKLQDYVKRHRSIAGYPGGKPISREEFFRLKADIFIPAALESLETDTDVDWRPRVPQWPAIGDLVATAIQSALAGQATPKAVASGPTS